MKRMFKITVRIFLAFLVALVILFIIFYILTTGKYEVAKTVEQDPSVPHIKTGNTVFHAETFGSDTNELVIAIHGGPGNDYRYILSLKELSDEFFVVFYDQRGTGLSPRVPAAELTLDNMLADLNDIIDYYSKGRKVNLIGHSWGAMLASGYIAKHPDKVSKAVLAEPGILTSDEAKEFMEKVKMKFSFALLKHIGKCWFRSLHVKGPDKQASKDYFLASFMLEGNIKGNPFADYYCNKDLSTASLDYWRYGALANTAIMRNGMDKNGNLQLDLVSGVENFKNKVLFIASECNTLVGERQQKRHAEYYPDAELVVIKNAGHTMFGEQPDECIRLIRQYLNE